MDDDLFKAVRNENCSRGSATLLMGDCLTNMDRLAASGMMFDAIITDPPYEIALHGKAWDNTGIAFSKELWSRLYGILKPGAFVISFAASRLYHRLAIAAEDVGFKIFPMLSWQFPGGLPKPANIAELFDRDTIPDRKPIGTRKGSGFTKANADHGAQQRITKEFAVYERGVSPEGNAWMGYYHGLNTLKPAMEPIMMGQKEPSEKRMIDNIRMHGTGPINIGRLQENRGGDWPTTIFYHAKARAVEHGSKHPSVKPLALMRELCQIACPTGGHILDPFGGTGTTAVAAIVEGFHCTVIEQNPEMEAVIRRRLTQ